MEEFISKLRQEISGGLRGHDSNSEMAPSGRASMVEEMLKTNTPVDSGVLILLYPQGESILTVLMQRPDYGGTHGGQISFPGGKCEPDDEDVIATALRETEEEIGVSKNDVNIVGRLSRLYIPPSNYMVYPVIGYVNEQPEFKPDSYEVEEVIETDINLLLDNKIKGIKSIKLSTGREITTPYYNVHGKTVWGATAMIISELIHILKRIHK